MAIVSHAFDQVVGVDTHAKTHTYSLITAATAELIDTQTFPTSTAGLERAISWMTRRATGRLLAAVEGTGSYGANLTRRLHQAGITIVEAKPPSRKDQAGRGKSDPIDAARAATSILGHDLDTLPKPRTVHPSYPELQLLLAERELLTKQKTAAVNSLTAMVRGNDFGVDARHRLGATQITEISHWRPAPSQTLRLIACRRAKAIVHVNASLADNHDRLHQVVDLLAPGLLDQPGVGPVTGGYVVAAFTTPGRIHSEAAFAAMAGVAPLPASSGNTIRHRLNRRGDRKLNAAIHTITQVRLSFDQTTRDYVDRRVAEGKTTREARRALKRYITRDLYRILTRLMAQPGSQALQS